MNLDDAWHKLFDNNAKSDLPDHIACCWTQEGYEERVVLVPELLNTIANQKLSSALDVGCGPGAYCQLLVERGFLVTGVDYSKNMLARAKKNVPQATFLHANAYQLPFENHSFDLVLSIGMLQCLEDEERAVRELCRVAQKTIICSTLRSHVRPSRSNPNHRQEQLKRLLAQDDTPTRTYHPDYIKSLFEKQGYRVELVFDHDGRTLSDCFFVLASRNP